MRNRQNQMMVRPPACDRARTWASLRLDGELSELEGALLDAHLARCPACSAAVAAIEDATAVVREAPFAQPPAVVVGPPARSSMRTFLAATASTIAATLALTGIGFVLAIHLVAKGDSAPKLQRVSAVASSMSDDVELLAGVRVLRNERPLPGHIAWPS